MKEDFLHYLWKFQKFSLVQLSTIEGKPLHVVQVGTHNHDAGPDFLYAKIEIDGQLWAGHVELHLKASDWYAHNHQHDFNYDNVVLHVVWEHDADVFRKDGSTIETLELKGLVPKQLLDNYRSLNGEDKKFIACENDFGTVDGFVFQSWLWRLFVERLQKKNGVISEELERTHNNWEAVLFAMLSKNFGLKLNGESFHSVARSVDYSLIQKCIGNPLKLEAILFGQAGLLENEHTGNYFGLLKDNYHYAKNMSTISNQGVVLAKFFRLRPPNFPTLRLSQLAVLWASRPHLFSELMEAKTKEEIYPLFTVSANEYWDNHYNFGIASSKRKKSITKGFMDLLIVNTVIPLKFAYAQQQGNDIIEELIDLALSLPAENNTLIAKFRDLRTMEASAWHSQALLQLKNEYCDKRRCLECEMGNFILKR
ncbi:MAG: DUF2851 family protein [Flavobacteriaceae bacterium]